MPRLAIHLLVPTVVCAALSAGVAAKPCQVSSDLTGAMLLAKADVAMDIPGTRKVALDRWGACLEIDVATPGTARLVRLLLRALDVPENAAWFRVVT